MAISTDNSRVYVNVGRAVACWDVADGKEIYRTQTIDSAYRLALSPDGSRIAIGEAHGHIEIFNAESGDRISEWSIENGEYILEVAFSPDGELLATAEAEVGHIPTPVRVWDVDTGYQLVGLRSPSDSGACYSVAFSHDGRTLAAGWGTTNKQERILLWDTALGMESLSYQWLPKVVAKAEASNE
jgi:WD40 repeat protein